MPIEDSDLPSYLPHLISLPCVLRTCYFQGDRKHSNQTGPIARVPKSSELVHL